MFDYLKKLENGMSCPVCKSVNSIKVVDFWVGLLPSRIPKGFHQDAFFSFECSACHSSFEAKGSIIHPDKIFRPSEKTVSQKSQIPDDMIERMGDIHVFRNE